MYKKGIVVNVSGSQVTVLPFVKDACATCSHSCAERGEPYTAYNPHSIPVKEGMVVCIASEKRAEALQGIFALLLPVLSAVAGFVLSARIAALLGTAATEGFKAVCTLCFLCVAALAVFALTRIFPPGGQNRIVEVYREKA